MQQNMITFNDIKNFIDEEIGTSDNEFSENTL